MTSSSSSLAEDSEKQRPLLRDANALRWALGFQLSLLSDQVWFVALAWAAVQAGTVSQVGLVLAAGSVPRAVLLLFGGAWTERWGPRRAAIGSDLARTTILLTAAGIVFLGHAGVVGLLILAVLFGAMDALFLPATTAMPQQLVAPDQMSRLNGLRSMAQRVAVIAGAPLGGLLVAAAGAGWALAAASVGTATSVVALLLTKTHKPADTQPQPRTRLLSEIGDSLAYVGRHPVLRPLLIMAAVSDFGFGGAVNVGLPLLSSARGWGAAGIGIVLGGFGLGASLTALTLVLARHIPHVGRWFAPLLALMAAALAAMAWPRSVWLTAGCAAVLGIGSGFVGSLFGSVLLTQTPPALIGRVSAVATLASLGLAPLGYLLTATIAAHTGPTIPYQVGAAIATIAIIPALATAVRRVQLPHPCEEAEKVPDTGPGRSS